MSIQYSLNPPQPKAGDTVCVTVTGTGVPAPDQVSVSIDGGPPMVFNRPAESRRGRWSFCFQIPANASVAMVSSSQGTGYDEKYVVF